MSARAGVALLGATGSIGRTAQRVIARHPDRFRIVAMTPNGDVDGLAGAVDAWRPAYAGVASPAPKAAVPEGWGRGPGCLVEAARHPEAAIVLNAVVGAAGLEATLAALEAGKRVALANKESLVVGGDLVRRAAKAHGGEVIPVDSEHSALLQCCAGRVDGGPSAGEGLLPISGVRRLIVTASGGRPQCEQRVGVLGTSVPDLQRRARHRRSSNPPLAEASP